MDDLELRLRLRKIEGRILILSSFVALSLELWVFILVPLPVAQIRTILLFIPLFLAILGMVRANPGKKEKRYIRGTDSEID